ncbi:MAG: hypothetical protein ACOC93_01285 [Planctomycetota bacterium]
MTDKPDTNQARLSELLRSMSMLLSWQQTLVDEARKVMGNPDESAKKAPKAAEEDRST